MRAKTAYVAPRAARRVSSGVTAPQRSRATSAAASAADDAQRERIEQHLPLVNRVLERVRRTLPRHIDIDDLRSAGITGLIAAAQRFDPERHTTFVGYACLRIRGAILDELRRLDWCPRRTRARTRQIQHVLQQAEQELGRAPTDAEMSVRSGLSIAELAKWREAATPPRFIALDQSADREDGDGTPLHELIGDDKAVGVRESLEHEELLSLLAERIAALPDAPKRILSMYYHEGMRLAEIATVFGRTESRISQIHSRAIGMLREELLAARSR